MSVLDPRGKVLSTRKAFDIMIQTIHGWQMDIIASIGARPGIGGITAWQCVLSVNADGSPNVWPSGGQNPLSEYDPKKWSTWDAKNPPDVESDEQVLNDTPVMLARDELGRAGLIRLEHAREIMWNELRRLHEICWRRSVIGEGVTRYRRWAWRIRMGARVAAHYESGCLKMLNACYSQKRKKRGMQIISSRHEPPVEPMTYFEFNGRPAFRAPMGRPPLPESVWLEHYRARLAKKRKGKARSSSKRAPLTRWGRPQRRLHLQRASGPSRPTDVQDDTDLPFEFTAEAFIESLQRFTE